MPSLLHPDASLFTSDLLQLARGAGAAAIQPEGFIAGTGQDQCVACMCGPGGQAGVPSDGVPREAEA